MFEKNDNVVHPVHGACSIVDICYQEHNEKEQSYYSVVPFADQGMRLMIPVEKASEIGVRRVISEEEANAIIQKMQSVTAHSEVDNKKRMQYYTLVSKSCDLLEMASLLKGLNVRDRARGLAFSEKKIYQDVEKKLCSELALAKMATMEEAGRWVEEALFVLA